MERVQPEKRKRAAKSSDIRRTKPKDVDEGLKSQPSAAEGRPPPSEEEVEEFFAILRRMHVAVRYLESTGQSLPEIESGERKMTGEVVVLDEEEEEVAAVRISQKEDVNGGFDLNCLPDAESSKIE
ncbi:hypothetical protein RJ641_009572 [Dillenia turbinata]|uniref:Uncharacterized protein n=1 Tax=Dillenia turbinata TaxID=194707 RepID=A0AAN8Z579_9MAGN